MALTCMSLNQTAKKLTDKYNAQRDLYRRSRQTQLFGTDLQFELSVSQHGQFEDQYRPLCNTFASLLDEEEKFRTTPRLQFEHDIEQCSICKGTSLLYEVTRDKGKLDGCHPDHLSHRDWLNRAERPLHAPIIARKKE